MNNKDNYKIVHFFIANLKLPKYLAKRATFVLISGIIGMLFSIIFASTENKNLSYAIIISCIIVGFFLAVYLIPINRDRNK